MGGEGAAPFTGPSREAPGALEYLSSKLHVTIRGSIPSSVAIVLLWSVLFIRTV
jgi:hypothetical protein